MAAIGRAEPARARAQRPKITAEDQGPRLWAAIVASGLFRFQLVLSARFKVAGGMAFAQLGM